MNQFEDKAREMLADGSNWEQIQEGLSKAGCTEADAGEIIRILKAERTVRNRNRGLALLMIGAGLCFGSMLFTFLVGHNVFVLYGLTMIGVTLSFGGLVYIMG